MVKHYVKQWEPSSLHAFVKQGGMLLHMVSSTLKFLWCLIFADGNNNPGPLFTKKAPSY